MVDERSLDELIDDLAQTERRAGELRAKIDQMVRMLGLMENLPERPTLSGSLELPPLQQVAPPRMYKGGIAASHHVRAFLEKWFRDHPQPTTGKDLWEAFAKEQDLDVGNFDWERKFRTYLQANKANGLIRACGEVAGGRQTYDLVRKSNGADTSHHELSLSAPSE